MKTQKEWFTAYAESHTNSINKKIHYAAVPLIFLSLIGLLMCIPNQILKDAIPFNNPFIENFAFVILLVALVFYFKLSFNLGIKMMVFSMFCIVGNYFIATVTPLLPFSVFIFIVSWIAQFYGHRIEGKKPSFLEDLQFLLIGPAWVLESTLFKEQR